MRTWYLLVALVGLGCAEKDAEIARLRARVHELEAAQLGPPPPASVAPSKKPEDVIAQRLPSDDTWRQLAFSDEQERRRGAAFLLALCAQTETPECRPLQTALVEQLTRQAARWSRYLHRDILDARGYVLDIERVARETCKKIIKEQGRDGALRTMRLPGNFGPRIGSALYAIDYDSLESLASP